MAEENSRKIPTAQELSVGNFRLAEKSDTSDKSAMATVDEVRSRLQRAFESSGQSPITLALTWELERNHIREFLTGKKSSLKHEVIEKLSEHFEIPIDLLIIRRPKRRRKAA